MLLHLVGILRDNDLMGAEAKRVLALVGRGGEDDDVRAEGTGELDAHVPQSAEADDPDLLAARDTPAADRRVRRDPGAYERRGPGRVEVRRDAEDECFVHDDAVGVAAVGDRGGPVLIGRVVCEHVVWAVLLPARPALLTGMVGVHEAADRHDVAGLVLGDARADLRHPAHDLVPGDDGVHRAHARQELVPDVVKVGVADAAEEDFDLHVPVGGVAPRDRGALQWRGGAGGRIGFGGVHGCSL